METVPGFKAKDSLNKYTLIIIFCRVQREVKHVSIYPLNQQMSFNTLAATILS